MRVTSYPTVPIANPDTQPFWDGCQRNELLLQRCGNCGHYRHPPSPVCSRCTSQACEWVAASGSGAVYTFTVVHDQRAPGWEELVPYVLAVIELDEGPHILSNVVDVDPKLVKIGMNVEVTFKAIGEQKAPFFRPRGSAR